LAAARLDPGGNSTAAGAAAARGEGGAVGVVVEGSAAFVGFGAARPFVLGGDFADGFWTGVGS